MIFGLNYLGPERVNRRAGRWDHLGNGVGWGGGIVREFEAAIRELACIYFQHLFLITGHSHSSAPSSLPGQPRGLVKSQKGVEQRTEGLQVGPDSFTPSCSTSVSLLSRLQNGKNVFRFACSLASCLQF